MVVQYEQVLLILYGDQRVLFACNLPGRTDVGYHKAVLLNGLAQLVAPRHCLGELVDSGGQVLGDTPVVLHLHLLSDLRFIVPTSHCCGI